MKTGKSLEPKSKSNEKSSKESIEDICDRLLVDDVKLFSDNYGVPFASIRMAYDNNLFNTFSLDSYDFRMNFKFLLKDKENIVLDKKGYECVLEYLCMLAYKNNEKCQLSYRVYNENNLKVLYELDIDNTETVQISNGICTIIETPAQKFKHNKTFKNQVKPDFNAKKSELVKLIKRHCNFKTNDDAILFSIYLVTCLLGNGINQPILAVFGQKGSAKSTLLRRLESIVDPKKIDLCSIPKSEDALALRLSNNLLNCFDNLSYIKHDFSDILCRSVTGGTITKRTLYENTDETVLDIKSIVAINGVGLVTSESDLIDRTIIIELERVNSEQLKSEAELNEIFEIDKPKILGCCFNILANVIADDFDIKSKAKLRMADFYLMAIKTGIVMGYTEEKIVKILMKNQKSVNMQAIDENIVAQTLIIFMEYKKDYKCSVNELLGHLKKVAIDNNISLLKFPSQANVLSRRLNSVRSNLIEYNISYDITNTGTCKQITIINGGGRCEPQ